jgi:hypothetical protein
MSDSEPSWHALGSGSRAEFTFEFAKRERQCKGRHAIYPDEEHLAVYLGGRGSYGVSVRENYCLPCATPYLAEMQTKLSDAKKAIKQVQKAVEKKSADV